MNTALRAVHEALAGSGDPADSWSRVVDAMAQHRRLDPAGFAAALQIVGVKISPGEWTAHLRQLGVVTVNDRLDRRAAADVAVALRLVGDSFVDIGPRRSWRPVATLPPELRPLLRPPALPQTAGVLLQLLEHTTARIVLAAPFVDDAAIEFLSPTLLDVGRKGADVHIVTSPGSTAAFSAFIDRWRDRAVGPLRLVEVATALSTLGSHAKVIVVDGMVAYVGSANLTAAGLGRHVEIGVEIAGPQVADLERLLLALARLGRTVCTVLARP